MRVGGRKHDRRERAEVGLGAVAWLTAAPPANRSLAAVLESLTSATIPLNVICLRLQHEIVEEGKIKHIGLSEVR